MDLENKIKAASKILIKLKPHLKKCSLCPRDCKVNRIENETGYCGQAKTVKVHTSFLHKGEEPPLTGEKGSGTIFFSGCSLRCVYCQNYKFSQLNSGAPLSPNELAKLMLSLEKRKAENINLVTATHFLPQIVEALKIAWEKNLRLPLVYNSSGYEKQAIVKLIEPLIDCWLLDFRYFTQKTAKKYSNSPQYPDSLKKLLLYLHQSKKPQKRAVLGQIPPLIIRHLILPGHIDESLEVLTWIKKNLPDSPVSVMSQYQPYFKAKNYPKINRTLQKEEYNQIKNKVEELQLEGWLQEFNPQEDLAGVYFKEDL